MAFANNHLKKLSGLQVKCKGKTRENFYRKLDVNRCFRVGAMLGFGDKGIYIYVAPHKSYMISP